MTPVVSRRGRRLRQAPRRAGNVKEAALLEVARDLVQRGAFQATPIGQIAKQAGISRQGFYFYYQSKDELLAQLVTETLYSSQLWRETLYDGSWGAPSEAVRGLVVSTLVMWQRHAEVLRAAVEMAPRSPAVWAHWTATVEETADFLVELVVASTTIEALRDLEEARRTIASLIWMTERNCYVRIVFGGDESDAALGERLGTVWVLALGLE